MWSRHWILYCYEVINAVFPFNWSTSVYLKRFIKRKFIQMSHTIDFFSPSLLQVSPNHAVMTGSVLEYVGRASISSAISCTEINNQQYQMFIQVPHKYWQRGGHLLSGQWMTRMFLEAQQYPWPSWSHTRCLHHMAPPDWSFLPSSPSLSLLSSECQRNWTVFHSSTTRCSLQL